MVNTAELEKGTKVHYMPEHYKAMEEYENGMVKRIAPNGGVFVVYNCGGDWDNCEDYTAANTRPEDLYLDWRGDIVLGRQNLKNLFQECTVDEISIYSFIISMNQINIANSITFIDGENRKKLKKR